MKYSNKKGGGEVHPKYASKKSKVGKKATHYANYVSPKGKKSR